MAQRRSYEDSCRILQHEKIIDTGEIPPMPQQLPRCDEEGPLGVNFFRTQLAETRFENLTLPRTFFGRSEVRDVSFRGSDLSESSANWNDFINVDFSDTDLSNSDLRASAFEGVRFTGAILRGADLRHASFTNCDFANADVAGLKITAETAADLRLSVDQRHALALQDDDGDEPDGG